MADTQTAAEITSGQRTTPPFRADHVGSLLRPPELLKAREDFAAGRIGADELRAIEDDEICQFLVALSRTRKACHLVSCGRFGNRDWTRPSRFGTWASSQCCQRLALRGNERMWNE